MRALCEISHQLGMYELHCEFLTFVYFEAGYCQVSGTLGASGVSQGNCHMMSSPRCTLDCVILLPHFPCDLYVLDLQLKSVCLDVRV